jgi:hypothetical protein
MAGLPSAPGATEIALTQHFTRCERAQHKIHTSGVGSKLKFAAPQKLLFRVSHRL